MVRRTNRTFNLGLVAAAAIVVLVLVAIVGAVRLAAGDIERGRTEGTARFGQLAEARILAQQARTDETLQLITRGDIAASEKSFYGHVDDLLTRVGPNSPAATEAVQKWVASHRKQVDAYKAGDYPGAVAQALDTDPGASGAHSQSSRPACATPLSDLEPPCAVTCRTRVATSRGHRRRRSC